MITKLHNALVNSISRNCRIILKLQNEIKTFLVIILLCFLTISIACKTIEKENQELKEEINNLTNENNK
jgi:hypothetical protein